MRKKTRENLLASTFLIAVLGLLYFQEKQTSKEGLSMSTTSIAGNKKLIRGGSITTTIHQPRNANKIPTETTIATPTSSISDPRNVILQQSLQRKQRPTQVMLQTYTIPKEKKKVSEYSKIVSPEQEAQIKKQYRDAQMKQTNPATDTDNEESASASDKENGNLEEDINDIQIPIHPTNLGRLALPPVYENLVDLIDQVNLPDDGGEIPFFWHIARGGGSTVKDIMAACLDITAASDVGARYGHDQDEFLNVIRVHGGKYVNVDATSIEGIERTKKLNAIESGLVDVVVSPRLFAASTLFTPIHKGRMFAIFRDPIERAVSMFYYLGYAKWEKTYDPDLVLFELQDYAKTNVIENNWMVRSLTNKMEGYLTMNDLLVAKEILRRKCLIGLMKEKHVTMKRFEQFYGWQDKAKLPGAEECKEKLLSWGWPNKHRHPTIEPGTEAYQLLQTKNALDIELYEYAKVLFVQQGIYFDLPSPSSLSIAGVESENNNNKRIKDQSDDMIG